MMQRKSISKNLYILLLLIVVFAVQTTVYASISESIKISGDAYSRPSSEVRITKFSLSDTSEDTTSMYEEYSKENLSANIFLPSSSSYVIYKLEVTNYNQTSSGIKDITGLPSGLTYELIDYKLKDKICDKNNNCGSMAKKEFYIKLSGTPGNYNFILTLHFTSLYNITYKNLSNPSYPNAVVAGETLTLDVSNTIMNKFYAENESGSFVPTLSGTNLSLGTITSDTTVTAQQENLFSYTGNYQTYKTPAKATYKIELWGAGGSPCTSDDATGGYVKGEIVIDKDIDLYLYLGGRGKMIESVGTMEASAGYNGGGQANNSGYEKGKRCGGAGATDVRLVNGVWNDFDSLKSRIMIAGGSGSFSEEGKGGDAGGLVGYQSEDVYTNGTLVTLTSYGGTQTRGGESTYSSAFSGQGDNGGFGYGGNGFSYASGGGGGYYGGAGGTRNLTDSAGGGGSSFISGHNGCVAIKEESTSTNIIHKTDSSGKICTDGTTDITCSYHYTGYIFNNTSMIDGNGYSWSTKVGTTIEKMPSPTDELLLITGNNADGYAKITLLELK